MSGLSITQVVARIADGGPVRRSGGGYMVKCPAHDDGSPSLSITEGTDQPVLLYCHAGCEPDSILAAVDLTWADVSSEMPERQVPTQKGEWTPNGPAVAIYDYVDEAGELLSQVLRTADKKFSQRVPDPSRPSGYRWSLGDVRRVLYHLPDVIEAVKDGQEVWVVEGEKDADNLVRRQHVCATCSIGGAGKWRHEYATVLRDASVTVVADKDDTGRAHARTVRASLMDAGARQVRIVEAAGTGKDATDHLDAGFSLDDFVITTPYQEEVKVELALDLDEYLDQEVGEQEFVIAGTLAKGEMMMLTGFEGFGKSTLLKQIAVQTACGIHPFTGERMPPQRVLFVDAENTFRDNMADFNRLKWIATHHCDIAQRKPLYVLETDDVDLGKAEDLEWLCERVRAHKPDLLIMGPIYNLVGRDLREEDEARKLKRAVNFIRANYGPAVILEHHAPHGSSEGRDLRPIGSSLLLRWPNFGYGLSPIITHDKQFTGVARWEPWRGPRRRSRRWPTALRQAGKGVEWMWEEASPQDVDEAMQAAASRSR